MALRPVHPSSEPVWRDDIATPVTDPRLTDILLDPRGAYSCPQRIAGHLCLSLDEKRLALCAWLRDLLAEGRDGAEVAAQAGPALAELCLLDAGAAAVFRRAFAGQGLAPPSC